MSVPKPTDELLSELDSVLATNLQTRNVFKGLTKEQFDKLLEELLPSSSRLGCAAIQSAILEEFEQKGQKSSAAQNRGKRKGADEEEEIEEEEDAAASKYGTKTNTHARKKTNIPKNNRIEFAKHISKHIKATLIAADLNAAINAAVFPDDAALQPSSILALPQRSTLNSLHPKPDFLDTLGQLVEPRILLRPHHCRLLQTLRKSLEDRSFSRNAISVYAGIMGGGKSTTMLVAEYFFDQASGLVITMSGRDFTDGSEPLAVLVKRWLVSLCTNSRTSALLHSIPYSVTPSSSLFDLVEVANNHTDLAIFIFEEFIGELRTQMSVPVLLVIDEYNAFLGQGKLKVYVEEMQQYIVREHVESKENAVASLFNWNTFRLNHGMALFGLSSSPFAHLTATDGNMSAVRRLTALSRAEVDAFVKSLQPNDSAATLSARATETMTRTGGVAREVNRFLIECAGNGAKYDHEAVQVYFAKFRKLLTTEGKSEFSEELRSSFSIIMSGLHLHYPVPFASIPALWRDSGIVALAADARTAQFVCPAQKRAVDQLFHDVTHEALTEAVHFLAADPSVSWRGLELGVYFVVHNSHRLTVPYHSVSGAADASKDKQIHTPTVRFLEVPRAGVYPAIAAGEFVLCWRNHSVIDMFAHSSNGDKYFIQVSQSPYRHHNTQLPNLFTHQIASPAGYDTVYDFYSKCTDNNFQVGQNPTQLQANEYYVYITSNTESVRAPTEQEKLVYNINGDHLQTVLGASIADLFAPGKKGKKKSSK